jgi:DNA-binding response OmpR family regulator
MMKVLVVDDSEIVLDMARDILEERGFVVMTALSAKDSDRFIYCDERPDVIVMDVMLPVLDGDKKTRMLKDDVTTRDIPVLLLSSKPEEDLLVLVMESGADGYIRKPFASGLLVGKIEEVVAGRRAACGKG